MNQRYNNLLNEIRTNKSTSKKKHEDTIDALKENIERHYESKRKELDILLTSSIPHQISNIKMVLWINFLFIGISLKVIEVLKFNGWYLVSYLFSFVAILMLLISLTQRKSKYYGSIDDLDYVYDEIKNDNFPHIKMLSGLLNNTFEATEYNRKTLEGIAKYLRYSIFTTLIAIFSFFFFTLLFKVVLENNTIDIFSHDFKIVNENKIKRMKDVK